jgi:hypothetical protein
MWNNIVIWARRNIFWVGIAAALLFITVSYWGCSSTPASGTPTPGSGWLFLKLAFIGLIVAAVVSRERPYLATTFSGLAVLVFLVILGKFDSLFVWAVLGFPLFASAGIYGATKTEGRTKSFLGFASGVLIVFWMFLLYLGHAGMIKIGFLGTLFPDDTAKVIFTVALAAFLFATWKRSKFFYLISFVVLLSFLGNATVNQIFSRFPEKLTPNVSEKTKGAWENAWDSLLNGINRAVKPDLESKRTRTFAPLLTGDVYAKINPLLDIDISASKGADASGDDVVVAPGRKATFKFSIKNPPSGTKRESVVIRITLKPSASKYLYFTVNGRKYEAFLDGFGRKSLGITSDMLTDINTLEVAGDSKLIINGKEAITVAKS